MRILVYGAGVIGCELAHTLLKVPSNQVTLLARGEWASVLREKGLSIRQYVQFHTTHDEIRVIKKLESKDTYDLVFVTMQQGQIPDILPVLSRNSSKYIVFVGNNLEAPYIYERLHKESTTERELAFGFQATGGRREAKKVVSVHIQLGMTVGALDGELSHEFKRVLKNAFDGAKYRLTKERQMDGWLKCHAAFILPICYVCYTLNGNLKRATSHQINEIIDATIEAHAMLKVLGYPLRPDGEAEYFVENRKKCYQILHMMMRTPLGKLAVSDHAMYAKGEIKQLDQSFEHLRMQANTPMPTWVHLRDQCDIDRMR